MIELLDSFARPLGTSVMMIVFVDHMLFGGRLNMAIAGVIGPPFTRLGYLVRALTGWSRVHTMQAGMLTGSLLLLGAALADRSWVGIVLSTAYTLAVPAMKDRIVRFAGLGPLLFVFGISSIGHRDWLGAAGWFVFVVASFTPDGHVDRLGAKAPAWVRA